MKTLPTILVAAVLLFGLSAFPVPSHAAPIVKAAACDAGDGSILAVPVGAKPKRPRRSEGGVFPGVASAVPEILPTQGAVFSSGTPANGGAVILVGVKPRKPR